VGLACLSITSNNTWGSEIPSTVTNVHQNQQLEALQSHATKQYGLFSKSFQNSISSLDFPTETPCVIINSVKWINADDFPWLTNQPPIVGHCVGEQGLNLFRQWVLGEMILRGYLTSMIRINSQDLSGGHLFVDIVPGRLANIYQNPSNVGLTNFLFPAHKGDLLNIRDLDQALESIRRLPGQALTAFDLIPGPQLGDTDIIIQHPTNARSLLGIVTVDNSGVDTTGRNQLSGIVALDSPLNLYDQLLLTYSTDAEFNDHTLDSNSKSVAWNVPIGYASFSLGASEWKNKQELLKDGLGKSIPYSSTTRRFNLGLSYVTYRSSHSIGSLNGQLIRRQDRSWVGSTELQQMRRDITSLQISASHKEKLNNATLDIELGIRASLPGLSAHPGVTYEEQDWTGHYRIFTAKATVVSGFSLYSRNFAHQNSIFLQYSPVSTPSTEYLQIGGLYTIRGTSGNAAMSGPNGWTWRNELATHAFRRSQVYASLDAGRVAPVNSQHFDDRMLLGSTIGLRGSEGSLRYNLSIGTQLIRSELPERRSPVIDFSLSNYF
jgi:hemolysin activation/secretion protein